MATVELTRSNCGRDKGKLPNQIYSPPKSSKAVGSQNDLWVIPQPGIPDEPFSLYNGTNPLSAPPIQQRISDDNQPTIPRTMEQGADQIAVKAVNGTDLSKEKPDTVNISITLSDTTTPPSRPFVEQRQLHEKTIATCNMEQEELAVENPDLFAKTTDQPTVVQKAESETIIKSTDNLEHLIIEESKHVVSGIGLGEMRGERTMQKKYGPLPKSMIQVHTRRAPSWKANAIRPDEKINESILQILKFLTGLSDGEGIVEQEKKFKIFLDATKQIVQAWRGLNGEVLKGRWVASLAEKVDGMHAILLTWDKGSINDKFWLKQGFQLVELFELFAGEWEAYTRIDLGFHYYKTKGGLTDNEVMEYIQPRRIVEGNEDCTPGLMEANSESSSAIDKSLGSQAEVIPLIRKSLDLSNVNPVDIPAAILKDHFRSCPSVNTNISIDEALHFNNRLQNIERLLENQFHQVNNTLEMNTILIQDIRDGIFGDWEKVNSGQNSEKRATAKRSGLLMMTKFLSDWKDECGGKVGRVEAALYGKKGDITSGGLVGSTVRIEDITHIIRDKILGSANHIMPASDKKNKPSKIWFLEDENKVLKSEVEKLKVDITAAKIKDQNVTNNDNCIQELKYEARTLRKVFCTMLELAQQKQSLADNWLGEAWSALDEACWPQGDPAVEKSRPEDILKRHPDSHDDVGDENSTASSKGNPVINQAGRGGSSGSSSGSCNVM